MNTNEAIIEMMDGKAIRNTNWNAPEYIYFSNGFKDENNHPINLNTVLDNHQDTWEIYTKPHRLVSLACALIALSDNRRIKHMSWNVFLNKAELQRGTILPGYVFNLEKEWIIE